ncbi:MAG: DoxX family protein [Bacteroidota bacterium]
MKSLKILLSLIFFAIGVMMLLADSIEIDQYAQQYDRPFWMYRAIGIAKVLGAIGLFFGEKIHIRLPLVFLVILSLLTVDALVLHLLFQEYWLSLPPAILLLFLRILYIGHRR